MKKIKLSIIEKLDDTLDYCVIAISFIVLLFIIFSMKDFLFFCIQSISTSSSFHLKDFILKAFKILISIEILRLFIDLEKTHEFHLSYFFEFVIIFSLRDIVIDFFSKSFNYDQIFLLCFIIGFLLLLKKLFIKNQSDEKA